MANSSILGGERPAQRAKGSDIDTLGPSDSSDSGSDVQGERVMPTGADNPGELGALPVNPDSDSDALGTGERGAAIGEDIESGADILPDRIATDPNFAEEVAAEPELSSDAMIPVEELAAESDEAGEFDDEAGDAAPDEAAPKP